jgi:2-amino-4-hydroxy-6-hydroxymethyldihydropteridine diphosphokinase
MSVRAYIGLGANLGDREATIDAALAAIGLIDGVQLRVVSPLYETEPIGPPQPSYLNGALSVDTVLSAPELLRGLLAVERRLGRVRVATERNAPRTIDLDLLLHGESIWREAEIEVPHPRLLERAFVLVPLLQIAPNLRHPVTGCLLASGSCLRSSFGIAVWRPGQVFGGDLEQHPRSRDLSKGLAQ